MSLRDLNLQTRRRLRRHAWLLTLWSVGIGVATSWLLLQMNPGGASIADLFR